jgi:hypothetical protein
MPGGPHLIARCALIAPPDELASKAFSVSGLLILRKKNRAG